jgi:hypothetical protein
MKRVFFRHAFVSRYLFVLSRYDGLLGAKEYLLCILVAQSFVRLIARWVAEAPLGYAERHGVLPA